MELNEQNKALEQEQSTALFVAQECDNARRGTATDIVAQGCGSARSDIVYPNQFKFFKLKCDSANLFNNS